MAKKTNANVRKTKSKKNNVSKNQKYAIIAAIVVFAGLGAFLTYRSFAAGGAFFATPKPSYECSDTRAVTKQDPLAKGKYDGIACYLNDNSNWTPVELSEYLSGNIYKNSSDVISQTKASMQQKLRRDGNSRIKICLTARANQNTYVYVSGGAAGQQPEKLNMPKSYEYSVNYCTQPRKIANWGEKMQPVAVYAEFGQIYIKSISVQGLQ